jgi:hypothetical protein
LLLKLDRLPSNSPRFHKLTLLRQNLIVAEISRSPIVAALPLSSDKSQTLTQKESRLENKSEEEKRPAWKT